MFQTPNPYSSQKTVLYILSTLHNDVGFLSVRVDQGNSMCKQSPVGNRLGRSTDMLCIREKERMISLSNKKSPVRVCIYFISGEV